MDSLAIKCYLISSNQEREIRRFSLDAEVVGNYAYLQEKIRCVYPQLIRESFKLSYMGKYLFCFTFIFPVEGLY